jgi:hypothetical protein
MAPALPAVPPVAASLPAGAGPPAPPPGRSFAAVLQRALAKPNLVQVAGLDREVGRPGGGAGLLEAVDRARAKLDAVLAAARSGRSFTAQELLGLQAETYRTVQTVDLATRLVEQGAQSVKQTLAAQV